MADYDDTEPDVNPAFPQDNRLDPALDQVRGMFTTPDGAELASTVLPIIQQHLNAVRVADTNAAAGQQVVTDLDQTKRNLVDMVKQDPTAAERGVALAPHLVADIVRGSGLDPDQQEAVHSDLTSHIQSEIARAAVTRMAELHANSATTLMDMLSDHCADTDKTNVSGYINTMEAARVLDHGAHTDQLMDDAARISRNKAFGYAQQLLDPRTESVQFPPTFMANLVAERGIAPADKAPLYTAFDNLRRFGDVPNSGPYVLSDIVKAIADPEVNVPADAILRHVGTSLRYADAQMQHGLSTTRTPAMKGATQQLAAVLDDAQRRLAPAADSAGNAAFGRFVNWLTTSYRRTGAGGLDPASPSYLFKSVGVADFAPRHDDVVPPTLASAERPSLHDIFSGRYDGPREQLQRGLASRGEPEDQTTNPAASLPRTSPPSMPLTPTERNQINNIERGRGAASATGADLTRSGREI